MVKTVNMKNIIELSVLFLAVACGNQIEHHINADGGAENHRQQEEPAVIRLPFGPHQEAKTFGAVIPPREHRGGAENQGHKAQ